MNAFPVRKIDLYTKEEFLEWCEKHPDEKFELVDGEIVAIAGASEAHVTITSNFTREIGNHLKGTKCFAFPSDWYLNIESQFCTYRLPDVMIGCRDDENSKNRNPVLIIEVTSKSTHYNDFNEKMSDYCTIPTLLEYAIVEQDKKMVYLFRKSKNWQVESYHSGEIYFESIDYSMPIEEIYYEVDFEK